MSDEPNAQSVADYRTPAGLFEHFCEREGCSKWGGWGFLLHGRPAYFCYEHRQDGDG